MAGVAQWVLDSAGVDDSGPTPMAALCAKRLGSPPRWISGLPEAKLEGKVVLLRAGVPAPIARGGAFVWGSERKISEAVRGLVREVHPLRIRDEPRRVGLMAREW